MALGLFEIRPGASLNQWWVRGAAAIAITYLVIASVTERLGMVITDNHQIITD
jgi:hypothetical protein